MRTVHVVVLAFLAASACSQPKADLKIERGSRVKIGYLLTMSGAVIDSTAGKEPLVFTQGSRQILAGLEAGLEGMRVGDKKTVRIPPKEAYGPENPAAFIRVAKASFPSVRELAVGVAIEGRLNGRQFRAFIARIGKEDVVLNLNHPLAGKMLQFDVEVMDILRPLVR